MNDNKFKPLIKYTGGKYRDYEVLKDYLPPSIENYYEPFFGGGGVFFQLLNDNKINGRKHINDFSNSLIDFYKAIPSDKLKDELYKIFCSFTYIKAFSELLFYRFGERFYDNVINKKEENFVTDEIASFIGKKISSYKFNTHGFDLTKKIVDSLNDKANRFKNKKLAENDGFTKNCIQTSICQAFYFIVRDMFNDWNNHNNENDYTLEERASHFFFIREYCFGGMFRFDSEGNFNVPYGGLTYNKKCLDCKIENLVSSDVKKVFSETEIMCADFEEAINSYNFKENDFMFLDPPYDSTFTDYDDIAFNREEHKRLAKCLEKCKCKWMLVIGKTDFIADLYKDYNIVEYDKTYMYNARGEYKNKHTTHLIITNY